MSYRADIDGLRAVAVLAVIIFHINEAWLMNGYLGVDVFFVISGYLVGGLLLNDFVNQRFDVRRFFVRRFLRLMPALLVFLAAMFVICQILFLPRDFHRFGQSLGYTLQFRANQFFAQGDYFDVQASERVLMHLWSLAIEEQFYILLPAGLVFLVHYRLALWVFLVGFGGVSIVYYHYLGGYFELFSRAFELFLGVLCVLIASRTSGLSSKFTPFLHYMAVLLLFLVFLMPLSNGVIWGHILACLGAILVVLFEYKKSFLTKKPLVFLGLLSYGLYLWHWGVLAVLRYAYMEYVLPFWYIVIAILATFLCAWISYHKIELPYRKRVVDKRFFGVLSLYGVITCGVSWYFADEYRPQSVIHRTTGQSINLDWDEDNTCHDNIKDSCHKGINKPADILVIGDSHAGQHNYFFEKVGLRQNLSFDIISADNCHILLTLPTDNQSLKCIQATNWAKNRVENYHTIIYLGRWDTASYFLEHIGQEIDNLHDKGKRVYLALDNPAINVIPLRAMRQYQWGLKLHAPLKFTPSANNARIKQIADKHGVSVFDIAKYIPNDAMIDGYPVYQDRDHINPYGSAMLGSKFADHEKLFD